MKAAGGFMSAASPGVVSLFFRNDHYKDFETYIYAIAEAMRHEYETVAEAGFVLQIDCPDLGMGRHIQYADLSLAEFRKRAQLHVEALNHAVANIPAEQLRMHVCWGNYEGPHHRDVALADVIDIVFTAKPDAISFEAANPRHAHEWTLFETVKLPDGKVLIPGVIESKSNFIEHPELIAQRIARYANLVGRENVIAGSDCGFGTWVGQAAVDPDVVFAKLAAMAEGAQIASQAVLDLTAEFLSSSAAPLIVAGRPICWYTDEYPGMRRRVMNTLQFPYDILLTGGTVIDPATGVNGRRDIAIAGGKIAAIAPDLSQAAARESIDLTGKIVTAGMIDTHAHVYEHVTGKFGLNPDMVGVRSGVTTLVDQGGPELHDARWLPPLPGGNIATAACSASSPATWSAASKAIFIPTSTARTASMSITPCASPRRTSTSCAASRRMPRSAASRAGGWR